MADFQPIYATSNDNKVIISENSQPEGSSVLNFSKVKDLGAASFKPNASATVPDQEHPEKYLNDDNDTIKKIVNYNIWYKDTELLKTTHNL